MPRRSRICLFGDVRVPSSASVAGCPEHDVEEQCIDARDNAHFSLLDHHTYLLNLTVANAQPDMPPRWELEYSARAAYNLTSLEPQQWDAALAKMEHDDELFNKFYRFYYKGEPQKKHCKGSCRRRLLCEQRTATSTDLKRC
ncbi:hypothetical protein HPB49_020809 [Dermacentor silvarum]|uniref:Uncharacterized protein n=1 Tax=Dermacentor silvarum TaxID=543639 RepID=A0ACB8DL32_DERSI|nr:hypothetical protein HPB49_020809 [Dermacentor silvarum]